MTDGAGTARSVKRRGILAAAGAVMAGIVAKQATLISANDSAWTMPYQTTTASAGPLIDVSNTTTSATPTASGIRATAAASGAAGVYGWSTNATGMGVRGTTDSYIGVQGDASQGIGVYGVSFDGIGMYGVTTSSYGYGVLGTATANNGIAIAGIAQQDGSSAFSGGTTNPNAYAAVFQGTVLVDGRLVVSDPAYKSGALRHPDGSHRLVYCVESPESWIEDVGTGTLTNGKATVTFDKDFAAVVHTDTYHVFLTEMGGTHHHLCVEKKNATGFTVTADSEIATLKGKQASDLAGTFSWKVMVKAKSGVKQERLGTFTLPSISLPDVSTLPKPPVPVRQRRS